MGAQETSSRNIWLVTMNRDETEEDTRFFKNNPGGIEF